MKTFSAKQKDIKRKWVLINAENRILGRLSTKIVEYLRGKNKPEYTPNMATGDHVIVINAGKIKLTGNKKKAKIYNHHTGYVGGIKSISFEKLAKKDPTSPIRRAVKGMLPKNSLGRKVYKNLRVYPGNEHPHIAQKPHNANL